MNVDSESIDAGFVRAVLRLMKRTADKAGRALVRDFGEVENLQVSVKGPGDFVSKADQQAEKTIVELLTRAYPEFGVLSEESGLIAQPNDDDGGYWIIDPLDGTNNFLHGIPHFCVSIGLQIGRHLIAGVIYDPIKHEMFVGGESVGATMNDQRLRVSQRRDILESVVSVTIPPRLRGADIPKLVTDGLQIHSKRAPTIRLTGSSALDLAYVACGRFDGAFLPMLKSWDVAAGIAIVRQSSGFTAFSDHSTVVPLEAVETGVLVAGNHFIGPMLSAIEWSVPKHEIPEI